MPATLYFKETSSKTSRLRVEISMVGHEGVVPRFVNDEATFETGNEGESR